MESIVSALGACCLLKPGALIAANSQQSESSRPFLQVIPNEFARVPEPSYERVTHEPITWREIGDGLHFSRTKIYRRGDLVDVIAAVRIDPEENAIRVFSGYARGNTERDTIEEWRRRTRAAVMINSGQYMADPAYMPCALTIMNGRMLGPRKNPMVRGMLVSEPTRPGLPKADLLDFKFDEFQSDDPAYLEGVMHWPILIDLSGRIRVEPTLKQANRTVVAKDREGRILFMTTEGGFFTLHNLARFLRSGNGQEEGTYDAVTAMNLDGGHQACMAVETTALSYVTYGKFGSQGLGWNWKVSLPTVIGVFPRE